MLLRHRGAEVGVKARLHCGKKNVSTESNDALEREVKCALWGQVYEPKGWARNLLRALKKKDNCYRVGVVQIMVRSDVCAL